MLALVLIVMDSVYVFASQTMTDNKSAVYKTNNLYRLRLISDAEMLMKAEGVYGADSLKSKDHTLDSARFGATITNPICQICKQRIERCVGHYSVIQLPFPIPRAISMSDFKTLVELLCPVCSHFVIDNIDAALELPAPNRLAWIRRETIRVTAGGLNVITCPVCNNKTTTIRISQPEPSIRFTLEQPLQNKSEQVNPAQVHVMLQNFTQLQHAGFNDYYHPSNFMTVFIPIIPNKLRPKTIMSSESNLTGYYRMLVEEICPDLYKINKSTGSSVIIERGEIQNDFNRRYEQLMSYYLLITDAGTDKAKETELALIDKRDKKHVDQYTSLLSRLKGKSRSIFHQGIIYTRHNVSARTVLGGANDSNIRDINIPHHIATKMSTNYPVFVQNLSFMQQLVASMSSHENYKQIRIPRVYGIYSGANGYFSKVNMKNALAKAANLRPGDKVSISLLNGDWVMQVRFPSLREESWTSAQVRRDNNSIITIPLPCCDMKGADFDGDEAQAYAMNSHVTDAESLLLHSVFTQLVNYYDGKLAIWYSADAPDGLNQVERGVKSNVYQSKLAIPPIDVVSVIESYLPPDLRYCECGVLAKAPAISTSKSPAKNTSKSPTTSTSKLPAKITSNTSVSEVKHTGLCIHDGKFVGTSTNVMSHELHKYMVAVYGPDVVEQFMVNCINLAYDINKSNGNTLGFEIAITKPANRDRIQQIKDANYKRIMALEQSTVEHRRVLQRQIIEQQKAELGAILVDDAKDTNLGRLKYSTKRLDEFYQMVVLMDYTEVDATLAEGTRTTCCMPRHSIDPVAYGYHHRSYNSDITPLSHFYDCLASRVTLWERGAGTAKQGYFGKRIGVAFGDGYVDFGGQVVDNFRIISPQYGSCGLDPRRNVKQPLTDISMPRDEFDVKYADDAEILRLRTVIDGYRDRYRDLTLFTRKDAIEDTFIAGFYYDQFINGLLA